MVYAFMKRYCTDETKFKNFFSSFYLIAERLSTRMRKRQFNPEQQRLKLIWKSPKRWHKSEMID
jgi:hypothetical protein